MATRARVTIPLLFLLGTSLLFAAAVSASHDEEEDRRGGHSLQQCVQRCQQDRPRYSHARCVQECRGDQQQHGRHEQEEQGRGRGRHGEGEREEEQGGGGRGRHGEGEREEEEGRGRGRHGEGEREEHGRHEQGRGRRGEGEGDEEQGGSRRPYVFGPRNFRSIIRSDHGFVKALRPFDEVSRLLRGIRNYRVAIMEVNPRAFVVPGFTDADGVGYVAQGEGVLTVIESGEKRSYTVRQGDVIVAPAGSIMHLANTDARRKLVIAKILHTISVPGRFQYFSAKPLLASLSKRVLRAALKTSDEQLGRLLGRRQGKEEESRSISIVRASEEQLRELSRQASEGGQGHHWPLPPFRGDSRDTFNLLEQRPKIANRHGRLYEADARSFHALAQHDVRVAVANITPGSMTAPYLNTQSFKLAVVLEGEGEVEIVCPHLGRDSERREQGKGRWSEEEEDDQRQQRRRGSGSGSESEEEQQDQQRYETVRARVSRGSAFVVPPGHPVVEIASSRGSSNLQVVCFEINAERNERVWLAGRNNVIGKLDNPAQELTFGRPAREVQEVFRAKDQQDEGFVAGPEQDQERGERGRGDDAVGAFLRMATGAF
ncbi:63 kDa globulin-like protein [Aegilops tauschii subsp. strangulata]|uniref:Cupin type-1 domain-containing protein n=1 Tax=Aegilops tauschii subsp. strangulata TaxID=200361 RepID=A0A453H1L1_AEGTS|nr:63 kDa globulin-like protein [Aegilops tauschii subsp. strangulata]